MQMLKRVTCILVIMMFLCMCFMGKVYGAVSCNIAITGESNVTAGGSYTVDVVVSNINSPKGLLALGAVLEYDTNKLENVKMGVGSGTWSVPSYNSANGKLITDRSDFGKINETVFRISYKVKDGVTGNAYITLKNISVADEDSENSVSNATKTITIKAKDTGNQGGNNNQGSTNQGNQNNGGQSQGTVQNGGSSTTNKGSSSNKGNTTNKNTQTNNNTQNQENNTNIEQRPDDENNNVQNEVNNEEDKNEAQENMNFVKEKERDNTLLIILIVIVIILILLIIIFVFIAKAQDKRTKKIGNGLDREEDE